MALKVKVGQVSQVRAARARHPIGRLEYLWYPFLTLSNIILCRIRENYVVNKILKSKLKFSMILIRVVNEPCLRLRNCRTLSCVLSLRATWGVECNRLTYLYIVYGVTDLRNVLAESSIFLDEKHRRKRRRESWEAN